MKIFLVLVASVAALALGGCADQSLISDEEYKAVKGPAPNSPDPMGYIPQTSNRPPGF
jgi:outer membrane lipoprotein SlyB